MTIICYSARCKFESWSGDCTLGMDYKKFEEKYGYSACVVGGNVKTQEEDKFIEENQDELCVAYQKFLDDKKEDHIKYLNELLNG